jgi:tetratricopeptide (TPR) repeat protein
MTYLRVPLACVLVVCAAAAGARADGEPEAARAKAKALLQEGARFMDERQYDRAVETFQEAYRQVPSPKVLYNLGVAYLSVARYADALGALERFLAEANDAPEVNRETARRHVADLRAKVSTLTLTSDRPRGELSVDGRSLGEVALVGDLTIDAGPHDLRAIADGKVVDERLTAPAGGRVAVALRFDAPIPPPPAARPAAPVAGVALTAAPADEPRPLTERPWFWIAAGGAVAAVATVVLVVALSKTEYPAYDEAVSGP